MRIFDCTTFYSEHLMMDIRFHVLNDFVEKFIVCESTYSHSGKKKKLNFNINNYPKFKDKISYIVIDEEPPNIIGDKNGLAKPFEKRSDSLKRINLLNMLFYYMNLMQANMLKISLNIWLNLILRKVVKF